MCNHGIPAETLKYVIETCSRTLPLKSYFGIISQWTLHFRARCQIQYVKDLLALLEIVLLDLTQRTHHVECSGEVLQIPLCIGCAFPSGEQIYSLLLLQTDPQCSMLTHIRFSWTLEPVQESQSTSSRKSIGSEREISQEKGPYFPTLS